MQAKATLMDWTKWEEDGEPMLIPANAKWEVRGFADSLRFISEKEASGWAFTPDNEIRDLLQVEWGEYLAILADGKDTQSKIAHIGFLCMLLWNRTIGD